MLRPTFHRLLFLLLILILPAGGLVGCSANGEAEHEADMADMKTMPAEVQAAPVTVREAYQFAVANPEMIEQFPCYCGCGAMGHTSNYSCYVQEVDSTGQITFDTHALGCSICVDITQDVMRLLQKKQTIPEIQAYIEATYSKYGPSNLPAAFEPAGPELQPVVSEAGGVPVCSTEGGQPSC